MRSNRRAFAWALAAMMAGAGCTEELPIEPIVSSADDWTPSFTIVAYGYQRVAIRIDGPPRKELIPNIARYILSIRELNDTVDVPVDTLDYVAPSYVDPPNARLARLWWTKVRVPERRIFVTKLSVEYHNGVVRSQYGPTLPRDPARGTILRRFDVSAVAAGARWWIDPKIALWKSRPLFNSGERLYVVDTLTGIPQYLGDLDIAGSGPSGPRLQCLGVDGDTLIAATRSEGATALQLIKLNLNTFAADSSISITWNANEYLMDASAVDGKIALLLQSGDGRYRITTFDTRTGLVLQAYPSGFLSQSIASGFCYDGTNFWVTQHQDPFMYPSVWFNPIIRLDPSTMSSVAVHRNPAWHFNASMVTPTTAWIIEEQPRSIIEARLEGF